MLKVLQNPKYDVIKDIKKVFIDYAPNTDWTELWDKIIENGIKYKDNIIKTVPHLGCWTKSEAKKRLSRVRDFKNFHLWMIESEKDIIEIEKANLSINPPTNPYSYYENVTLIEELIKKYGVDTIIKKAKEMDYRVLSIRFFQKAGFIVTADDCFEFLKDYFKDLNKYYVQIDKDKIYVCNCKYLEYLDDVESVVLKKKDGFSLEITVDNLGFLTIKAIANVSHLTTNDGIKPIFKGKKRIIRIGLVDLFSWKLPLKQDDITCLGEMKEIILDVIFAITDHSAIAPEKLKKEILSDSLPNLKIRDIITKGGVKEAAKSLLDGQIKPKYDTATALNIKKYRDEKIIDEKSFDYLKELYYNNKNMFIPNPESLVCFMKVYKANDSFRKTLLSDYVSMSLQLKQPIQVWAGFKKIRELHDNYAIDLSTLNISKVKVHKKFAPLAEELERFNNLTHIDSKEKLIKEAETMKHCVATYARDINNGYSDIWHAETKYPFTIEFVCYGNVYYIRQIETVRNMSDFDIESEKEELTEYLIKNCDNIRTY